MITESTKYPGYYHIPGFNLYVVNRDGDIIQTVTGHRISYRKNPRGYYMCSLVNNSGVRKGALRSRILCSTFKPCDGSNFLQVDHVNCIHWDDRLENLEWVTGKENCQRASKNGLYKGAHPVKVRDWDTGKVIVYPSILAAGRAYGLNKDQIMFRLEGEPGRIYPERKQYKFLEDMTNWAEKEDAEIDIETYGTRKKVLVRNLVSGEVKEFDKLSDLADFLNISMSHLSTRLSETIHPLFPGFYQVKLKADKREWRCPSNPIMELCTVKAKAPVVVTDSRTGEKTLYMSQHLCAVDHRLLNSTLNERLKHSDPKKIYSDGFSYRYYSEKLDGSTTSAFARSVF